jgi:hypothetical protein
MFRTKKTEFASLMFQFGTSRWKKGRLVPLLLLVFMLSSCSGGERVNPVVEEQEDEAVEISAVSAEADPREPLYVYKDEPKAVAAEEIILALHADPVLLPVGYVRLAGMVSGVRPLALLDIAGKGRGIMVGDLVAGYRVVGVFGKQVVLNKGEK